MAKTLLALKSKITEGYNSVPELKYLIIDDLSEINQQSKVKYPCLLVKPPESEIDKALEYENYTMEMFIFDIERFDSKTHWIDRWDILKDYMISVIAKMLENKKEYVLISDSVSIDLGHFQHNDKLIGVRATFIIRVYYGYGC